LATPTSIAFLHWNKAPQAWRFWDGKAESPLINAADAEIDNFDQRIFLRAGIERRESIARFLAKVTGALHRFGNRAMARHDPDGLLQRSVVAGAILDGMFPESALVIAAAA